MKQCYCGNFMLKSDVTKPRIFCSRVCGKRLHSLKRSGSPEAKESYIKYSLKHFPNRVSREERKIVRLEKEQQKKSRQESWGKLSEKEKMNVLQEASREILCDF